MKVLITGGSGLLGRYLIKELVDREIDYFAPDSSECDITSNRPLTYKPFRMYNPDIVIHCAAIAKFKLVEENPLKAMNVNVVGTSNIVNVCASIDEPTKLVYISTDHVFDGKKGNYSVNDNVNPLTKLAKTKVSGELITQMFKKHLIIRTSFCPETFPFDTAYTDKWTSQDYVDLIAPKILDKAIGDETGICHVGHPRRSFYELAKTRNPNVKMGSVSEIVSNSDVPILIDTSLEVS